MTACSRGCCWNPWGCSLAYQCPCHWSDRKPAPQRNSANVHRDPTAQQAIRNITRQQKGKR